MIGQVLEKGGKKMSVYVVVINPLNPNNWRPFEKESMQEYFGNITVVGPEDMENWEREGAKHDIIYWHLDAEKTPWAMVQKCIEVADKFETVGKSQINHPKGWVCAHAKDKAYEAWQAAGIPTLKFFTFDSPEEFLEKQNQIGYPMLIRVNDGNTGEGSAYIADEDTAKRFMEVMPAINGHMTEKYGPGVGRTWIAAEFVDHVKYGYRYSCRIIVAGNKVVTGYARPGDPAKWAANDDTYMSEQEAAFVQLNKECQAFCEQQEGLLVEALRVLGVNYEGVDVIFRDDGSPVFLEIQPDFDCGNPRRGDGPPWYNPSNRTGAELVKFISDNEEMFKKELSMYYFNWLDKRNLFDECHKALLESFR